MKETQQMRASQMAKLTDQSLRNSVNLVSLDPNYIRNCHTQGMQHSHDWSKNKKVRYEHMPRIVDRPEVQVINQHRPLVAMTPDYKPSFPVKLGPMTTKNQFIHVERNEEDSLKQTSQQLSILENQINRYNKAHLKMFNPTR